MIEYQSIHHLPVSKLEFNGIHLIEFIRSWWILKDAALNEMSLPFEDNFVASHSITKGLVRRFNLEQTGDKVSQVRCNSNQQFGFGKLRPILTIGVAVLLEILS